MTCFLHDMSNLTFDYSEQKTQVECLSSSGRDGIHESNGLVSLTNLPYSTLSVPDKPLGKLLIEIVMCSSSNEVRILICLEPAKQLSVLGVIEHLLQVGFSTKDN